MRNPLNKRFPKEFKKNAGRYICIFILLVITIIIGAGFMVVMDSSAYSLEKNEIDSKVEDGYFEVTKPLTEEIKEKLVGKEIQVYENFYVTEKEFDKTAKLLVFDERKKIDLPSIFEGRLPEDKKESEIAIDRLFAKNRKIILGDTITVNGTRLKVVGLISLVDYNALFLSNQDMVMNTTDFGVSVVTEGTFEKLNQASITYRYSYQYKNRNLTEKEKLEEAMEIQKLLTEEGMQVQEILPAEKNQCIHYLKEDMGHDGPMVKVFIYILVLIIAFIFAILTSNTIEAEATIIGTLRALGYKKGEIIWHYLFPTIVIALFSAVIGNVIGYTLMIEPFKELYYSSYCLPPLEIQFNSSAFVLTTVIPIVIMLVINFAMLASKISLSPLKFLRKDLKKKRQKKAIRLPNAKFLTRFRMRVILQNKGSYFVLFFGIFLSSFLLMFGMGVGPLMDHYVEKIDDTVSYEYLYMLKAPVEANGGEKLYMYSLSTNYYLTGEDINVSFYGVDAKNTKYFKTADIGGEKNEIAITDSFAKKCKIKAGDEVLFKDKNTEKEYTLKVSTINSYTNNLGVYIDIKTLRKMLDVEENAFNTYVSDKKLDIEDAYIAKYMTRSDMLGAAKQMMISFDMIIKFLNIFSVFAYMVFMYLLTKVVIDKNALYISFMKVFGYEKKEIRKLYLDASAIVVIVSLIICIPLEVYTFKLCIVYISSLIEGYMEFYLPAITYIELVAIGIIAYFAVNWLHLRKVRRIPMSEALKNRE